MLTRIALVALLPLFIVGAAAPQTPAPAPELLTADTPRATPAGTTFTVPAGWSITTGKDLVILQPLETDTHIVIVDSAASEPAAAVDAAWKSYRPSGQTHPVKLVTTDPPRDGWEERKVFDYETSPNERLVIRGEAFRAGGKWTVFLYDATEMTFGKRLAPIRTVYSSVRPKGYHRESFAGRTPHHLDQARISELKSFVQTSMQQLGVPGVALALIEDGKVVYQGGLGVRELGKPDLADENTLFMIASNTKGMSTLLLSELVDEKKLKWDEPVINVYPAFKLGDSDTTRKVLVKNLVCACTGLPRQDYEWILEFKDATPESTMALLGTMKPTSKFGEVFQYSNLMAAAAGYIGGHIVYPNLELGAAYDKAMQEKIFTPLSMKTATFDYARALAGNHASPHGDDVDGKPAVASMDPNYSVRAARPAGGAWASVADMVHYVQLELARGKLPTGKQLVSEQNLLERRVPQVPVGEDATYGMGLEVSHKYDVTAVFHGGSMFGYKTNFYLLPDFGIGAIILTNADTGNRMLTPFMRRLLEVLFDGKPEAAEDVAAQAATYKAWRAKERQRLTVPADPASVSKLASHYTSKELGDITVTVRDGVTTFDFGEWKSSVASRKNDDATVSFITIDPTVDGFEFIVAERGDKRILIARDAQHEYTFTETP